MSFVVWKIVISRIPYRKRDEIRLFRDQNSQLRRELEQERQQSKQSRQQVSQELQSLKEMKLQVRAQLSSLQQELKLQRENRKSKLITR